MAQDLNPNHFESSSLGSDDQIGSSSSLSDCETPKANTFDPFAPASEDYARSRMVTNKFCRKFILPPFRTLDFDACVSPIEEWLQLITDDDEELVLDYLYHSFIELIIRNENIVMIDGYATPAPAPRSTDAAYRCPDAPLRTGPTSRLAVVEPEFVEGMCRKLEFDSC